MNADKWLPALLVTSLIVAPGATAGQVSVGIKGGVTSADPSFDAFSSEPRAGAIAGGFVNLPIMSGRASVQIESLYTTKGFATAGFLTDDTAARIPYLDFPVLFKLRLTESPGRFRPSVLAGPFWGIELACSTRGAIVELEGSDSCDGRFRGRGTADVGFIFGGNLDVGVSERLFLIVDGRYHLGLRNLHFDPDSDASRSRAWSVLGGIGLELGG